MGDASIVHISIGRLSILPPSNALTGRQLVFHHWSRSDWRRTQCGRLYETDGIRQLVAVRRDTAELIADPCSFCFTDKWRPYDA
jgi:hypothetical protein